MKPQKTMIACFLTLLILFCAATPAFAAPLLTTESVTPPQPNGAVVFPEGASDSIDWEGLTDDIWRLLFTGSKRKLDISKYHIPVSEDNKEAIFFPCWYEPRFLRIAPVSLTRSSSGYYVSVNNLTDSATATATDPAENRVKYDACADAVSQLTYGIKGNDAISQVDKALLLHDRLVSWTEYDYDGYYNGTLPNDSPDYSAYGPLVNHLGVCNGYALAYNWLLQDVGMEAWYENSEIINHGWSKVQVDGELYYVDPTWDDPLFDIPGQVMHDNFMQSFSTFSATHSADDFDDSVTSTRYENYFSQEIQTDIIRWNGADYYFNRNAALIRRDADGTETSLLQLQGFVVDGTAMYNPAPKLTIIGDKLLYLTPKTVRAYDLNTGDDTLVYEATENILRSNRYFLNGLKQVDGVIYVTSTDKSTGEFQENTVAQNTESFSYCTHPVWEPLTNATQKVRSICPACRALCTNHNFTAQTVSNDALQAAATCTAPAMYYYSCVVCGAIEQNDAHTFTNGEALNHDWQWVIDTPATCATAGSKHESCTRCNATRSENTAIDPTGAHSYTKQTVSEAALQAAATCTAPATYYYSCTVCGAIEHNDSHTFTDGEALGHDWTWIVDTEATCATAGSKHEVCTRCNATRSENTVIDPTSNHSYTAQTVSDDALQAAATCTDPATYYYSCEFCGTVEHNDAHTFTDGDALGHDWQWVIDTEATCATAGSKHEVCTLCNATRSENTAIDPTGAHSYTKQTVSDDALQASAICTVPATYYYSCEVCGSIEHNDSHTFVSGEALGHDWQWVVDTEATCATAGTKHEVCTRCNTTRSENTTIDPTGNHSYTAQTVSDDALQDSATCTVPATYYYRCTVCGAVEHNDAHTFTDGDALGHNWQWVIDAPATCDAAGSKHESCTRCNTTRSENTAIDPTGAHSYTKQTVSEAALQAAATCTVPATYYYSCAVCGTVENSDSHTFVSGEALGHDWQWVVDTEATCATAGSKHEACTRCDATRSENTAIDPTGAHNYTKQTVSEAALQAAATCTVPATYYYSCAVCGTVEHNGSHTFTDGAALGHDWKWVIETEATCAAAGVKHEACTRCDATRSENTAIAPTGAHSYTALTVSDAALKAAASCTAPATYYYSCTVCGAVEQNDSHTFTNGAALGHDWRETARVNASCTKTGSVTYTCTHDSTHVRTETLPTVDHADNSGDGYCDSCGKDLRENRCPYCGQVHTGFFGLIVGFFHRILALFKR